MNRLFLILIAVFLCGCQTIKQDTSLGQTAHESRDDQESALLAVVGAVSDKELSEKDLRNLVKDIKNDEEARSAINVVADSISNKQLRVKYCPVTGKRYAASLSICPVHNVELKWVE
ncbi:MAG: hypothetical protein A2Y03_06040 [Omnitrophica WOR_2 bacterium GWF2_38_59]|nr:MAG: hypothetical protein A2Y03_06040 [Omnitrophica WOR_2 bacterium GWF2_38_59]OGX46817.1 MAG: hypothetical protein A2243_05635 [Omnitrophica WOR_2 bacterium RIFOXYA2_FULL_38_17]OGX51617.1 MAG: hypothetical protein A2267_04860 [Omnitrophica WOR_2 bacterium RIFOXYA12_FULL_38_10]OGX58787.1 MAG: hypothetical protein A2447_05955 [Omnitrophica WOR_2 bacterium RIFOXYC2_FULL_38_12]OGX59658.1 MAG: hypothetical protein A2306_05675 [Omnitrophica WOR_2 bacterium RIFOXYB2_FULL_38_16]HBG61502.1 hypothet